MDFRETTVSELADAIQRGEVSARELVTHALDRIESHPELGAFVAVDGERALAEADDFDASRAAGNELPPLAGVPIGVKDLEDAEGFVTTYGSVLHRDDAPAAADSVLVDRLRQAGCIVIGKTNTPEHGWKGDTHNNLFGGTANPWNTSRSAGGSSGGSAAAVAGGLVPLATASDGGGSIRIPAALCGLPGFKPSSGRIPMGGPKPAGWPDLSVKGILTGSVRDTALVLDAVIGPDPSDQQSLPMPERSWYTHLTDVHLPKRVVWSPTLGYASVDAEVLDACESAIAVLESAGTEVIVMDEVFEHDPVGSFLVLSGVPNLRTLAPFRDHPEWDQVDEELRAVLGFAETLSAVDFVTHRDNGHLLNCRLIEVLHAGSFLLTPTVAGRAGPPGGVGTIDGVDTANWVQMTYPFNLTRSPAGTVPVGLSSDGMPIGLQVVGPQHADVGVLRFMAALEDLFDFTDRPAI